MVKLQIVARSIIKKVGNCNLLLLGSYYTYWSCKCFHSYFLDQLVQISVNGGKLSNL